MDAFNNSDLQLLNFSHSPEHMRHIVQQYTNETFWFSACTVIALVISYCVVIIAGLAGNILVIIVVCRKKALRSSRNMYILNLSVCDVIMCSVCMPLSLVKLTLKKWTLGWAMCRILPALATIDVFVSTQTMVVIAVDRYLSIVHSSHLTTRHVISVLVIIWVLSILLSTPLFCFHKIDTQEMYEHTFVRQCIDAWPNDLFREIYTTFVMLIQYLTPTSVISCLHARICKFLQYRLEDRPGSDTQISAKAKADMRRHRRNMVLLTAMALLFSITWLPLTVLNITADLGHEVFREGQYNLLHAIGLLIAMMSSAANPIMYGWFNSNFRKAFCELLGFPIPEKGTHNKNNSKKSSDPNISKKSYSKQWERQSSRDIIRSGQESAKLSSEISLQKPLRDEESRTEKSFAVDAGLRRVDAIVEIPPEGRWRHLLAENSKDSNARTSNERGRLTNDRYKNPSSYHSISSQ